jgi:hypothetical protein
MVGVAGVLAGLMVLSAWASRTLHTYQFRTGVFSQPLCNSRECTVFLVRTSQGWAGTLGNEIAGQARVMIGLPTPWTHIVSRTTILRVTANTVQTTDIAGGWTASDIFEDTMYMGFQKKWADGRVQSVPVEESARLFTAARCGQTFLYHPPPPGWTTTWRKADSGSGAQITASVDRIPTELTYFSDGDDRYRIELRRGSGKPETIWQLDGSGRYVRRETYYRVFDEGSIVNSDPNAAH